MSPSNAKVIWCAVIVAFFICAVAVVRGGTIDQSELRDIRARVAAILADIDAMLEGVPPPAHELIWLNSPDHEKLSERLQTLPQVGPSRAKAIIDGQPWASVAELESISGLTASWVALHGSKLAVNDPASQAPDNGSGEPDGGNDDQPSEPGVGGEWTDYPTPTIFISDGANLRDAIHSAPPGSIIGPDPDLGRRVAVGDFHWFRGSGVMPADITVVGVVFTRGIDILHDTRGLRFVDCDIPENVGIRIQGDGDVRIEGIEFYRSIIVGNRGSGHTHGGYLSGIRGLTFRECFIHDNHPHEFNIFSHNLYISNSHDVLVERNFFGRAAVNQIKLRGDSIAGARNIIIRNNVMDGARAAVSMGDSPGDGVVINEGAVQNVLLSGNIAQTVSGGFGAESARNVTVTGNTIFAPDGPFHFHGRVHDIDIGVNTILAERIDTLSAEQLTRERQRPPKEWYGSWLELLQ